MILEILKALKDAVGLKNIAGTQINPAKEDGNLADIKAELQQKTEPTDQQQIALVDLNIFLRSIWNLLTRPIFVEPGSGRIRATIEAGTLPAVTTVTTVTTVSAVTSMTQFGGHPIKDTQLKHAQDSAWALCVRARVT